MKLNKLLDVSKYNHPILFILSLPLLAVAALLFGLFCVFAFIGMLVGRRPAFQFIEKLIDAFSR